MHARVHARVHFCKTRANTAEGIIKSARKAFTDIYGYLFGYLRIFTHFRALCARTRKTPQRGSSNLRERHQCVFTVIYGYLFTHLGSFLAVLQERPAGVPHGPSFRPSLLGRIIARIDVFSRRFDAISRVSGETRENVTHSRMNLADRSVRKEAALAASIYRHNRP